VEAGPQGRILRTVSIWRYSLVEWVLRQITRPEEVVMYHPMLIGQVANGVARERSVTIPVRRGRRVFVRRGLSQPAATGLRVQPRPS
jgi:hypothetical protein